MSSEPNYAPTAYPIGLPNVDTLGITQRIKAIANLAASKPSMELAEVTAVSIGSSITVKKIGTTVTIPNVKLVGWTGSSYPVVGEFVWLVTLVPGAQPFTIGTPAPEQSRCKVYLSTDILAITNAFPGTVLAMDGTNWTEEYEKIATHDFVTNNSRITVTRSGIYRVEGCITYAAGGGIRATIVTVNGAAVKLKIDNTPSALFTCTVDVSLPLELAVNDYVELLYVQNTGGNLGLVSGRGNTYLSVVREEDIA